MTKLDEALRSLRDDVDGKSTRAEETRNAILGQHRPRANKFRYLTLLAAAALFIGTSEWAGFSGRFRAWVNELTQPKQAQEEVAKTTLPPRPPLPLAPIAPTASVSANEADAAPLESAPRLPEVSANSGAPNETTRVTHSPTASAPQHNPKKRLEPPKAEELDAYEKAHRAHFARSAEALALWDEYIRKYPNGKWQPEARYNRAICHLRAGDKAAAKAALEPYARGDFGGYRQSEAQSLLNSLVADAGD